jgi:hypothetical protein
MKQKSIPLKFLRKIKNKKIIKCFSSCELNSGTYCRSIQCDSEGILVEHLTLVYKLIHVDRSLETF